MKLLELGYNPVLAESGHDVVFLDLGVETRDAAGGRRPIWAFVGNLRRMHRECGTASYNAVVVRALNRFIYRRDMSLVKNVCRWLAAKFLVHCVERAQARGKKIVVVDVHDETALDERDMPLLRLCDLYFKRELPLNLYTLFCRVKPHHEEPILKSLSPSLGRLLHKLRPLSIGLVENHLTSQRLDQRGEYGPSLTAADKEYDIFFAGGVDHSSVRQLGLGTLEVLRGLGYRVLVLDKRVPVEEFWHLMSRSWLTWSPEGLGWDCYRHYEAGLVQSVPVMNYPSIRCRAPYRQREHAFYYNASDPASLQQVIEEALKDKAALLSMGAAARAHVLDQHVAEKRSHYVIEEIVKLTKNETV